MRVIFKDDASKFYMISTHLTYEGLISMNQQKPPKLNKRCNFSLKLIIIESVQSYDHNLNNICANQTSYIHKKEKEVLN